MSLKDTDHAYGFATRLLHWILLVLVALQFLLAVALVYAPEKSTAAQLSFMTHEATGLLIFVFAVLFVVWRLANRKPTLANEPAWQQQLARFVHIVIYIAIGVQPLFGVALVMLHGHGVTFFGLPVLPQLLPESKRAGSVLGTLHVWTGWYILLVALGVHLLAALYHHFVRRDHILRRMMSARADR